MPNLYNPNLPGAVISKLEWQVKHFHAAGWRLWDDLTAEQQAAHESAAAQAEPIEPAPTGLDVAETPDSPDPSAPESGDPSKE